MNMGVAPTQNLSFYQNIAPLGFYGILNPVRFELGDPCAAAAYAFRQI